MPTPLSFLRFKQRPASPKVATPSDRIDVFYSHAEGKFVARDSGGNAVKFDSAGGGTDIETSTGGNGAADEGKVPLFGAGGQLRMENAELVNSGGFVATLEPAAVTADREYFVPDYNVILHGDTAMVASSPSTGFTIAFLGRGDHFAYLTPAGTLATGTVTLPAAAAARVGQLIRLWSTQIVTALTVNVSGGGAIQGAALTAAAANTPYAWQCVSTSGAGTWVRLQ